MLVQEQVPPSLCAGRPPVLLALNQRLAGLILPGLSQDREPVSGLVPPLGRGWLSPSMGFLLTPKPRGSHFSNDQVMLGSGVISRQVLGLLTCHPPLLPWETLTLRRRKEVIFLSSRDDVNTSRPRGSCLWGAALVGERKAPGTAHRSCPEGTEPPGEYPARSRAQHRGLGLEHVEPGPSVGTALALGDAANTSCTHFVALIKHMCTFPLCPFLPLLFPPRLTMRF